MEHRIGQLLLMDCRFVAVPSFCDIVPLVPLETPVSTSAVLTYVSLWFPSLAWLKSRILRLCLRLLMSYRKRAYCVMLNLLMLGSCQLGCCCLQCTISGLWQAGGRPVWSLFSPALGTGGPKTLTLGLGLGLALGLGAGTRPPLPTHFCRWGLFWEPDPCTCGPPCFWQPASVCFGTAGGFHKLKFTLGKQAATNR